MPDLNDIGNFIARHGFPVFVAIWLLLRVNPRLDTLSGDFRKLEQKISDLTTEVSRMLEALRFALGGGK